MALLSLPNKVIRQPHRPARVDPDSPLLGKRSVIVSGIGYRNWANGFKLLYSDEFPEISPYGLAFHGNSVSSYVRTPEAYVDTSVPLTLAVIAKGSWILSCPQFTNLSVDWDGGWVVKTDAWDNSARFIRIKSSVIQIDKYYRIVLTIDTNKNVSLYVEGDLVGQDAFVLMPDSSAYGLNLTYINSGYTGSHALILKTDKYWPKSLVDAWVDNPWQFLQDTQEILFFSAASGGGGITASLSGAENNADESAIAGTVTVMGSINAAESSGDNAALSGSVAYPGISGSISVTESGADSVGVTGVISVNAFLSATESTVDDASVTGAIAATGTLSATESGSDTASITGNIDNAIHGSVSATETGADSASISGNITATGSLSATESGSDSATISGATSIIGALGATEANADSAAISGQIGDVAITGNLAATESGNDSAFASGSVGIAANLSATETGVDSVAMAGHIDNGIVTGSLNTAESEQDAAAALGAVGIAANLSVTESGQDSAAISGSVAVSGDALNAFARVCASSRRIVDISTFAFRITHITTRADHVARC